MVENHQFWFGAIAIGIGVASAVYVTVICAASEYIAPVERVTLRERLPGLLTVSRDHYLHYGLAVNVYTHFTSPIRRYADVVSHWVAWKEQLLYFDFQIKQSPV